MKIKPMLVAAGPLRPENDLYALEVKWDGPNRRSTALASLRALSVGERPGARC